MARVAGVDPGTHSFDLCVMDDGAPVFEQTFPSGAAPVRALLQALALHGPYELVYGPSGYGVPLTPGAAIGEPELAQMVLVRPDEAHAPTRIMGMRSLLRELASSGLPVIFGPGVIHLPSVPGHRKYNRIDLGTADKVCAGACAIAEQCRRCSIAPEQAAMVLLELGGAFSAALAITGGQIVDGLGGASGPLGAQAAGALDGEVAYLLGPALRKRTLFTGGALDPTGMLSAAELEALWGSPAHAEGWLALLEATTKAVRSLLVSVQAPREIVVSGRLARQPELVGKLRLSLADVAPVVTLVSERASVAARGAAMIADGLAGGPHTPIVAALRLRESSGSVLDHLRLAGADQIRLG